MNAPAESDILRDQHVRQLAECLAGAMAAEIRRRVGGPAMIDAYGPEIVAALFYAAGQVGGALTNGMQLEAVPTVHACVRAGWMRSQAEIKWEGESWIP